jgi:hypothetical protein
MGSGEKEKNKKETVTVQTVKKKSK